MKTQASDLSPVFRGIIIFAALIIIVAGMMHSKTILIPLMMATFIAIICSGPKEWLQEKNIPEGLSLLIVLGGFCIITLLVVFIVGSSVESFSGNLPEYEKKLNEQMLQFSAFLNSKGLDLKGKGLSEIIKPASAMKMAGDLLSGFSNLLTNGFLILLLVIFMLLEASGFPLKMKEIYGDDNSKSKQLKKFSTTVKKYMYLKTIVSLGTGVLVILSLVIIGVDYPILWGLLAFAFNFIPNVGSIIAAIPAVLLALIQLGPIGALITATCYLVINIFMGNVVEPRIMGKELGLSTFVVFLSLLFWGWVLGPVGMLLSVILTMKLKIMLECNESTLPLALLLGPNPKE